MSITLQRNHRHIAAELRPSAKNGGNVEVELSFDGFELVVRGDYSKPEKQWFNPAEGIGHPGKPEDFDVNEVYLADSAIDIMQLFDVKALAVAVLCELAERRDDR